MWTHLIGHFSKSIIAIYCKSLVIKILFEDERMDITCMDKCIHGLRSWGRFLNVVLSSIMAKTVK